MLHRTGGSLRTVTHRHALALKIKPRQHRRRSRVDTPQSSEREPVVARRRQQPRQPREDTTAAEPDQPPTTEAADDSSTDETPAPPARHTTVDLSPAAGQMLRGFRLHALQHGPVEGLRQFDQFLIRGGRELLDDLQTRYHQGEPFPQPQVRLPKGTRAGTIGPSDELVRFSARVPADLLAGMRGALLWLQLNDTERAAEQIGMAPEFWSVAVLRLGRSLQGTHGITLT